MIENLEEKTYLIISFKIFTKGNLNAYKCLKFIFHLYWLYIALSTVFKATLELFTYSKNVLFCFAVIAMLISLILFENH